MSGGSTAIRIHASSEDGALIVTAADGTAFRLSEFVGTPQDTLAPRLWTVWEEDRITVLSARWGSVWMEKRIVALSDRPTLLRLHYTFRNAGPIFVRPGFGLRLSLPAGSPLRWSVPTATSLREGESSGGVPGILYLGPSRPWCAASTGDHRIALLFPDTVLDAVEIENGEMGAAISPLVYHLGLSPDFEARVTCAVDFAAPPPDEIELRCAAHATSLQFSYGRASRGTPEATEAAVSAAPSLSISAERRQSNRRLAEVAARLEEGRQKRLDLLEQVAQGKIRASDAGAILPHGR